jgi:ribosomal protein S7
MRKEKSLSKKLCNEFSDILNDNAGNSTLKRKNSLHLLVETNRAFAQLRW